ncbi:cell cycle checkpoint protein RAD1-like isoform X2 [Agrilus planipennis]|uniref:Cell cycle checkpoint protein RAD1-like isoform X2 n=1 Tax=Agrilus planipennis TaxID=224129 RepID=A0A1W4WP35_AGRPL|nr:cell cycle checkpoint protein RAD1-like isoform X2 [Agrilus planipennis]
MDIQFLAEIKDLKVVYNVLKSIIFKDFVVMRIMEEGMKITVDDMKCVETSVYIPSNIFFVYKIKCDEDIVFKISHKVFTECLHIFGDDGNPSMKMSYKGPGFPLSLVLKHQEENIIVDCEIKTMDVEDEFPDVNLAEECNLNNVVLNAGHFVEILSNIDHNSDELELFLSPEPPYFRITTYGVLVMVRLKLIFQRIQIL